MRFATGLASFFARSASESGASGGAAAPRSSPPRGRPSHRRPRSFRQFRRYLFRGVFLLAGRRALGPRRSAASAAATAKAAVEQSRANDRRLGGCNVVFRKAPPSHSFAATATRPAWAQAWLEQRHCLPRRGSAIRSAGETRPRDQPSTASSRPAGAASSSRRAGAAVRFRPRPYCRGEQPITRLKAVLKALSDS